jgi:peroxiredoxin
MRLFCHCHSLPSSSRSAQTQVVSGRAAEQRWQLPREFRVAYTRLVVIRTDNPLNLNEFRDSLGAPWPFLGDPDRTVQHDVDIEEFTDPHNPMIPHVFVLEPGLRIFSIYNDYW